MAPHQHQQPNLVHMSSQKEITKNNPLGELKAHIKIQTPGTISAVNKGHFILPETHKWQRTHFAWTNIL